MAVLSLPCRRWGRGATPVLFLHGFTGGRRSFEHLEALLGDVVQATNPALPGHDGAPLPGKLGAEGFDETIAALAGALDRPHVVVGYSQGARLALALAVRHPASVQRLVLESCNPGFRRRRDRAERQRHDELQAESILAHGVEAFVRGWEQLPLFAGLRALPAAEQDALRARRTGHTAEGLSGALRCLGQGVQPDLWSALPSLRVPSLLLTGAGDARYTRLARRMAAELPLARRVSFRGVGHAPHLECPREYASEVRAFLDGGRTHEPHLTEELRA